jgi:hypothetical protein
VTSQRNHNGRIATTRTIGQLSALGVTVSACSKKPSNTVTAQLNSDPAWTLDLCPTHTSSLSALLPGAKVYVGPLHDEHAHPDISSPQSP